MTRTWFITGASRGFGALIAKQALGAGDNVVATGRNPEAVLKAVGAQPNLLVVALDVTDEAQAHVAAASAVERFGAIDVLVNNAGFGLLGDQRAETARGAGDEPGAHGMVSISGAGRSGVVGNRLTRDRR